MAEGHGNEEKSVGADGLAGKSVLVSIRDQLNAFRRTTSQNNSTSCIKPQQIIQKSSFRFPSSTDKERRENVDKNSLVEKAPDMIVELTGDPSTESNFVESRPKNEASVNEMELSSSDNITAKANVIRPIDRGVVHQICSGQVIVTLSTAVKELVENSLDAGATKIDVRLQEYGSKLIEVSDDGNGIEESNFEGLALKHHTSKISDFGDLTYLSTFGFRGEALSSLCALSKLTVTTRHKSSGQRIGHKLEYDYNGKITSRTHCARESGTTVILNDLFHTLPVRHREFMKNLKRDFHKMVNILYGYCLVVNGTRISCTNQVGNSGPTKVIGVPSYTTMKERIVALFGSKQFSSLLEIKQCNTVPEEILSEFNLTEKTYEKKYELEGYISIPNQGRSSNDRQFFFINSRPCDAVKIGKVINEVYHSFSRHQNPFVCLHIKTNREDVDVNVTPDKRTLYVRNEKILLATLKATLIPLLTVAASSYNPNNSQLSSKLELSFDSHFHSQPDNDENELGEGDISLSPASSPSFNVHQNWSQGSQKSSSSQGVFDRQYSGSGPSRGGLSKSVGLGDFLNKFKSDSSSSKRQRTWESSPRDFKTPKLTNYLRKYDAPEKQSIFARDYENDPERRPKDNEESFDSNDDSDDGHKEVRKNYTGRSTKSEDVLVCERDSEDMEVLFDDDYSEGSNVEPTATSLKTIKVSVNWSELSTKLASMKVKNEGSHSSISYSRRFRAKIAPEDNTAAEEELKKQLTQDMFSQMEILGQFNLGFIVVKNGPDLFIVDQHASDEKFNFEDLQKTTVLQSQPLIRPLDLQLPAISENIIMDNIEAFQKNGFDFIILPDEEPTARVKLSRIPYSKNTEFGKADVEELVFMMEDASDKSFYRPTKVREMLASRACRKSVMIGTALSAKEMRAIVNHMGEMAQPWNCPHGRPTIRHLINLNILPDMDEINYKH